MSTNNLFNSSSASNSLLSNAIAPGVYTQIIPSQQYNVTETGTNALICFFSDQGPDNVLTFLGSQSNIFSGPGNAQQSQNFIQLYGKPNLAKYTSAFGQGPYVGSAYSQISSSLYCLRLLPPNAQYANIVFGIGRTVQNQLVTVQFNLPSLNQISQLDEVFYGQPASAFGSDLEFVYFMPLFVISSTYRGSFYNNFQIYATPLANVNNQFNFQIYQNTNGTYFQITSYNGSFNPNLLSNSGNTTLITSILDNYDPNVQIQLQEDNILSNSNYVSGDIFTNANEMYNVIQVQDCVNNINQIDSQYINGTTKFFVTSNAGGPLFGYSGQVVTITSSIQNGLMVYDVTPVTYNCNAVATSGTAGQIYSPSGTTTTNIEPGTIIITSKNNIYISVGFGDIMVFDPYTYCLMINATQNSSSVNSPLNLMNGSEGSLITSTGVVDTTTATELLEQGYQGLIDSSVLDLNNVPIDLVLDAGYPLGVKQSMVTLTSMLRMDCLALLDLSKNLSSSAALQNRLQNENFDTFYAAIFDPYVNISDIYSGKNIWVSPIYVVGALYALNDKINNVAYAVANTNGIVNNINRTLYQPGLTEYYENQINPILTTTDNTLLYGQLTTQREPNVMQNINVVRVTFKVQRDVKNLCRNYVFDFNDQITWNNIQNTLENYIAELVSEKELFSGSVSVIATQYQIQQNAAMVNVIINPTDILYKILIPIYVQ